MPHPTTQLSPYETGFRCRCPRCGQGRLLHGLLSLRKRCPVCGLDYGFADAADGPAVFVTFIVGFLATGLALGFEFALDPPIWLHVLLWPPVITVMAIGLLRPLKGVLVALQYHHDAKEGVLEEERGEK